jgi:tight adherence protein C
MPILQQIAEYQDMQPIVIGGLIAIAVFAATLLVARAAREREIIGRRVTADLGGASHSLDAGWQQHANRLMERAAIIFAPGPTQSSTTLGRELFKAGYFSPSAAAYFNAVRIVTAIALPSAFLLLQTIFSLRLPLVLATLAALGLALLGLVLPSFLLDAQIKKMRGRYRNAFPDMMDLLVVCVESGQSVQSAIAQVAREMMQVLPQLGFNLHLVSLELRAGGTIHSALMSLHGRVGLDEVKSLAVLMKQSEELGASISGTLHVFSEEMRDKRLIRAETQANLLPVKMTIPLGLFIFPVILLAILVPVAIRIKNSFV